MARQQRSPAGGRSKNRRMLLKCRKRGPESKKRPTQPPRPRKALLDGKKKPPARRHVLSALLTRRTMPKCARARPLKRSANPRNNRLTGLAVVSPRARGAPSTPVAAGPPLIADLLDE